MASWEANRRRLAQAHERTQAALERVGVETEVLSYGIPEQADRQVAEMIAALAETVVAQSERIEKLEKSAGKQGGK